ncbi:hypothetical protein LPW11_16545 [Geomonas sp. RF6]|uniref:hypothetical protein n=1 Tax=Geomonas sp. RF6 TaxID=2897342 RepID=UPI001E549DE6|nr:hypothetical protein [Geomonas sp. RF6]UFS69497.1 hypothetical protein LPW11_16545 [Geomonas sp. RF6]
MKWKGQQKARMVHGVAWYSPDQWERLLEISDDRDVLEKTYAEWERFAMRAMKDLTRQGLSLKKVPVDLDLLLAWCQRQNVPIDGAARSLFVAAKMKEADKG